MATADRKNLRVVITLEGEAMERLIMWAKRNHLQTNVAAKKFLMEGMTHGGLIIPAEFR